MDKIRELIIALLGLKQAPDGSGFEGFTDEQLAQAKTTADEQFATAKSARDIEVGRELAEALKAINAERADRAEATATVDEEFATLEAEVTVTSDPDPDPDAEPGSESDEGGNGEAEPAAPEVIAPPVAEVVPIAAAATPAPAPAPKPVVPKPTIAAPSAPAKPLVSIVASGDIVTSGKTMTDDELIASYVEKADILTKSRNEGKIPVAKMKVEFPAERFLSEDDSASTNTKKIMDMVAAVQAESRKNLDAILAEGDDMSKLMTLTAEGGLCAPVNVRYEIFTLGTDKRPLRDALLRFGATRGGIQFNEPPTLADVDGSVQITTEAQDTSGALYPKDCIRVDCGDLVTVKVSSISLCMEVGNFQRLSFPENFRAWWDLGKVEHARQAETYLWNGMVALSLALTAAPDGLGTARRVIAALARGAQQYRDRFRTGDEAIVRAYIPSWLLTMIQVDFLRQAPGDNAVGLAKATIVRYLAAFNIACTFVLDGQAPSSAGYAQTAGALNPWNQTVDIIYTVDGTFLHTDMGELNFGTEIRDFTQIRNNDSGAFFETFENVARVGPQAGRLRLTNVCSDGTTSGPADDLSQLCDEDY